MTCVRVTLLLVVVFASLNICSGQGTSQLASNPIVRGILLRLARCEASAKVTEEQLKRKDAEIARLTKQEANMGSMTASSADTVQMQGSTTGERSGMRRETAESSVGRAGRRMQPSTGRGSMESVSERGGSHVTKKRRQHVGNTGAYCKMDCQLGTQATSGFGGGISCSCPTGYTFKKRETRCADNNDCTSSPCRDDEICVNTHGSFSCEKVTCDADYNAISGRQSMTCFRPFVAPCQAGEPCKPSAHIFAFTAVYSNLNTPQQLYSLGISLLPGTQIRSFAESKVEVSCEGENCDNEDLSSDDFLIETNKEEASVTISLARPITGPLVARLHLNIRATLSTDIDIGTTLDFSVDVGPCLF